MSRKNKSQGICRVVALATSFHLLVLLMPHISAQLAWSPIQVDSESEFGQIDLYASSIIERWTARWIIYPPYHLSALALAFSGQVDLWTRKSVGCACSWKDNEHDHAKDKHETSDKNLTAHNGHHKHNGHQLNCACCVKGGCQCGETAPNRCSQCGLENHCLNSELESD